MSSLVLVLDQPARPDRRKCRRPPHRARAGVLTLWLLCAQPRRRPGHWSRDRPGAQSLDRPKTHDPSAARSRRSPNIPKSWNSGLIAEPAASIGQDDPGDGYARHAARFSPAPSRRPFTGRRGRRTSNRADPLTSAGRHGCRIPLKTSNRADPEPPAAGTAPRPPPATRAGGPQQRREPERRRPAWRAGPPCANGDGGRSFPGRCKPCVAASYLMPAKQKQRRRVGLLPATSDRERRGTGLPARPKPPRTASSRNGTSCRRASRISRAPCAPRSRAPRSCSVRAWIPAAVREIGARFVQRGDAVIGRCR